MGTMSLACRIHFLCGISWSIVTTLLLLCGQTTPVPHAAVTEFLITSTADLPAFSPLSGTPPAARWEKNATIAQQAALSRDRLVFLHTPDAYDGTPPIFFQTLRFWPRSNLFIPCLSDIRGMLPFSQAPPVILF